MSHTLAKLCADMLCQFCFSIRNDNIFGQANNPILHGVFDQSILHKEAHFLISNDIFAMTSQVVQIFT